MSFLDEVMAVKAREIAALRVNPPLLPTLSDPGFAAALRVPGLSVIAEIKRRSPSKGDLAPGLDAQMTARAYTLGGAAAISCLTDREFFGARPSDLASAREAALPVLRKDFILDEVQIDETAALGASAVLLIVRILEGARLKALLTHAGVRGLDALVEVHDEAEIERAVTAGATVIGVNNRDLGTLQVDHGRAQRVRRHIPKHLVAVAESGVRSRDDVMSIEAAGFDAVLIGEALATSSDPTATLKGLMGLRVEAAL